MEEIKSCGLEESKKYFHPGDYTHSNDYGAYLFASFVAAEVKKTTELPIYRNLGSFLRKNVSEWEADKEKLKMPRIKGEDEEKKDEPYKIAMDRLEEIIRRK